ncbi:SUN domain-containing protein 2-like [Rutidosis leptorrhynchoides]|uniref:SUN domain-containing protein 2-like n=1 Tax=Rutidosis leptorrhynchoides TaxID=125765 RepID=UPI003A998D3B
MEIDCGPKSESNVTGIIPAYGPIFTSPLELAAPASRGKAEFTYRGYMQFRLYFGHSGLNFGSVFSFVVKVIFLFLSVFIFNFIYTLTPLNCPKSYTNHSIKIHLYIMSFTADPISPFTDGHRSKHKSQSPRRRTTAKKSSSSSKPLWKTILSIFIKNSTLLLIMLLFIQMFRKLVFNQLQPNQDSVIISSDYEAQISELDTFLKTTAKMIQNRIDSVDQKIGNEIEGLKKKFGSRIDENAAELSVSLSELVGKIERMENWLTTNGESEWLLRDEFDKFVEEVKAVKKFNNFGDLNLDEVRAFAKGVVKKEIDKHAADGIGRVDYAAASGGATVVGHSDAVSLGKFDWVKMGRVSANAVKMLQPSFGEPGQCFPLKGNNGFVEIKLRTAVIPEAVTLEHVDKSVAFDRSSAPKNCRVYGWLHNKVTDQKRQLLTEFVYDLEKSNAQTFNVLDSTGSSIIDTIRLDFTSNYGNPTHTCIYRLRVHGQEPYSFSSLVL